MWLVFVDFGMSRNRATGMTTTETERVAWCTAACPQMVCQERCHPFLHPFRRRVFDTLEKRQDIFHCLQVFI